jgi:hypothetical protein
MIPGKEAPMKFEAFISMCVNSIYLPCSPTTELSVHMECGVIHGLLGAFTTCPPDPPGPQQNYNLACLCVLSRFALGAEPDDCARARI